jgi:cytochrome c-type biogenesis protein CcmE
MKLSYILGAIVIIAALIFAMFSFTSSLTSYVTISEAKETGQNVQVAGVLGEQSINYDVSRNLLIFTLMEPQGDEMIVHYAKSKPANFENADKIVAIGRYDKSQQVFVANELLVKCPSKYEGRISQE